MTIPEALEHARRLLPGRVFCLAFASEIAARAFRRRMYRKRAAARLSSYHDEIADGWGKTPWEGVEIALAAPTLDGQSWELRITRRADMGPVSFRTE